MKRILFATDFSEAATQALNYVIEIARKTGAEIYLLNTYLVPATEFTGKLPIYSVMVTDEKINAERKLKDIIHLISNIKDHKGNYLTYKSIAEQSDPVSAINKYIEKDNFDLIVIGNTGIDDPFRWYQNTAMELIKQVSVPLLIVPAKATTYRLKHIVYAAELVKDDAEAIKQLVKFAISINAWITVLHIITSSNTEDKHIFRTLKKEVDTSCNYHSISWHSVYSDNVKKSITDLLNTDSIDLLSLLKYSRKGIESLFHKSLTNALIQKSEIPLLIMHKE